MKSYNFTIYKDGKAWKYGHCLEQYKKNYEAIEKLDLFREGCYIDFKEPKLNRCEYCDSDYAI